MKYQAFVFESYQFNHDSRTLSLHYSLDGRLKFTETYHFDFEFVSHDPATLDRACQLLWLVAGVSYYKTYLPPVIDTANAQVDRQLAGFLRATYQKGLGEFFYVNQLDPETPIDFPVTVAKLPTLPGPGMDGLLVGIGGGKDSLVAAELLRDQPEVATWSLNHRRLLQPLVERIGMTHFYVERQWDAQLLELNKQDAYNGHVPISAIIAAAGVVVSLLTGYANQVVANESSASEPNLIYREVPINHQYSKSLEFEQAFQTLLTHMFHDGPWYFSLLRPFSELRIAELFAAKGWFDKYKGVFSSCNRAFTHSSTHLFWDGTCPKCAFVFLALTPFVPRADLEALFKGKNLLLDPALEPTYRQLLGIEGDKPLECVGEVKESRSAMRLAQAQYPELTKYDFYLPGDYDFRTWGPDSSLWEPLRSLLKQATA